MKRVVMRSISIQFLSPCCTTTLSRKVPPPAKSHFNPCSRHTSKGAQEFLKGKKLGILQLPCQSPDQPNRLCFSDVKCNIDCRKTQCREATLQKQMCHSPNTYGPNCKPIILGPGVCHTQRRPIHHIYCDVWLSTLCSYEWKSISVSTLATVTT